MPKLNTQQAIAANTDGRNIIVSASAGTGKTTLLIERILRLIIDEEYDINDFLVMSFTVAAAEEIRARLGNRLKEVMAVRPEKTAFISEQLAKLPSAAISTIDAFCLDIVRKYGYILDIDPSISENVMDDSQVLDYSTRALDLTLSDLSRIQPLVQIICPRVEDVSPLESIIIKLADFMNNLEDIDSWKSRVSDIYDSFSGNIIPDEVCRIISRMLSVSLQKSHTAYGRLVRLYTDNFTDKMKDSELYYLQLYRDCQKQLLDRDFSEAAFTADIIRKLVFPRLTGKKDFSEEQIAADKAIQNNKALFKDGLDEVGGFSESIFCLEAIQMRDMVSQLIDLAITYRDNFRTLKKNDLVMDFTDMEEYALEILQAKGGIIADNLRKRFREIMVDEYQDSSQCQENIIRLINRGNNVFRVGDVKQSIYGFRNAKPELMKSLIRNHSESDLIVNLRENYRSRENILLLSNRIFSVLMNVNEPDTYQTSDDFIVGSEDQKKDCVPVRVEKLVTSDDLSRRQRNILLAKQTVREIEQLHNDKQVPYGRIVVLLRGNRNKALLKDALNARGIPNHVTYSEGFFSDEAVSTVISLIELILDEDNDLAILDVLRGPLFEVSENTIAEAYLENREISWHQRLSNASSESPLCRLNELIIRLRNLAYHVGFSELLTEIYRQDGFYLKKASASSRENLDALSDLVAHFGKTHTGLGSLSEYLQLQKKTDKAEASSSSEKDDVVRVMTIHHSKGLEFDHLYFIDFSADITASREPMTVFDEVLGMAMENIRLPYRIRHDNGYLKALRMKKKLDALDEELRLLYVAITRAKYGLTLLYSPVKENEFPETSLYSLLASENTYVPWIINTLGRNASDIEFTEITEKEFTPIEKTHQSHYDFVPYSDSESRPVDEEYTPSSTEDSRLLPLDYSRVGGAERGTLMHETIETLGLKDPDIDSVSWLKPQDLQLIRNFYDNDLTRQLAQYQCRHELPFIYQNEGRFVNGIIDLLVINDQDIWLIDFKTDRHVSDEILAERYGRQLKSYYQAVASGYPDHRLHVMIYSFYLNRYVIMDSAVEKLLKEV